MRKPPRLLVLGLALVSLACYHQIVRTGRPAGTTVVDMPWVSSWLWGLVPAEDLNVSPQCPSGVAVVETEQSFANGFVGLITLGIYTPQHVRITCASGGTSLRHVGGDIFVAKDASPEERAEAFRAAIAAAERTNLPVVVRF
jgi:Bor protein